ncbi:MAG: hypothetical protein AUK09_02325 [Parcubacteria group bacterium CG2_30_36_38]|nr:MAG: hypothetical protein AUK09_02325 [Parcubacteria group bacterium CG2_30_36_38]
MKKALKDIKEASKSADFIELRIDYLKRPDLKRLLSSSSVPMIVTNRAQDEGGHFKGTEEKRLSSLKKAIDLGAAYIDIELSHYIKLEKKRTKIIVSYHNFYETPINLKEIYQKILAKKADIVKIACKANNKKDVKRVIKLLESSRKDMIGICMGEIGKITRLHPKNYLTFACLNTAEGSAPGQFTIDEMLLFRKSQMANYHKSARK